MTSKTGGGLTKISTAWEPELLKQAERIAARRRASRNNTLNYLVSRGIEADEAEQAELERLRRDKLPQRATEANAAEDAA